MMLKHELQRELPDSLIRSSPRKREIGPGRQRYGCRHLTGNHSSNVVQTRVVGCVVYSIEKIEKLHYEIQPIGFSKRNTILRSQIHARKMVFQKRVSPKPGGTVGAAVGVIVEISDQSSRERPIRSQLQDTAQLPAAYESPHRCAHRIEIRKIP